MKAWTKVYLCTFLVRKIHPQIVLDFRYGLSKELKVLVLEKITVKEPSL